MGSLGNNDVFFVNTVVLRPILAFPRAEQSHYRCKGVFGHAHHDGDICFGLTVSIGPVRYGSIGAAKHILA